MKSKHAAMFGLMAAFLFAENPTPTRDYKPKPNPQPPIPRGCKKYNIKGIEVIAISESSAIKKVERKLKRMNDEN